MGQGEVFIVRGDAEPYYIVVKSHELTSPRRAEYRTVWLCGCRGWRYSETDLCKHVTSLQALLEQAPSKSASRLRDIRDARR